MFGNVPGANAGINFHLRAGREDTNRWEDLPVKPVPPGGRAVPSNNSKLRPWWVVHNSGGVVVDERLGTIGNGFRKDKVVQFGDLKPTDDAMMRAAYENTAEYLSFKGDLLAVKHDRCKQVYDARLMNYLEHRYDTLGPFFTPPMHGPSPSTAQGVSSYIAQQLAQDEARARRAQRHLREDAKDIEEEVEEADEALWRDYETIDHVRSRTIR